MSRLYEEETKYLERVSSEELLIDYDFRVNDINICDGFTDDIRNVLGNQYGIEVGECKFSWKDTALQLARNLDAIRRIGA